MAVPAVRCLLPIGANDDVFSLYQRHRCRIILYILPGTGILPVSQHSKGQHTLPWHHSCKHYQRGNNVTDRDPFSQLWCYLWAALELDDDAAQLLARELCESGRIDLYGALPVWDQWENLPPELRQ